MQQLVPEFLVGGAAQDAAWYGLRPEGGHQLDTADRPQVRESPLEHAGAPGDPEVLEKHPDRRNGVGLVLDATDGNAQFPVLHGSPQPLGDPVVDPASSHYWVAR